MPWLQPVPVVHVCMLSFSPESSILAFWMICTAHENLLRGEWSQRGQKEVHILKFLRAQALNSHIFIPFGICHWDSRSGAFGPSPYLCCWKYFAGYWWESQTNSYLYLCQRLEYWIHWISVLDTPYSFLYTIYHHFFWITSVLYYHSLINSFSNN